MSDLTDSRLAMYEGIISLAWADHSLHENEKAGLHQLIDANPRFTDDQGNRLHNLVNDRCDLADVWERITDKYDRAYLLDTANYIFTKDGLYTESEQDAYDVFLADHLNSINANDTERELRNMAITLKTRRLEAEKVAQQQAKQAFDEQFSIVKRIKKIFS